MTSMPASACAALSREETGARVGATLAQVVDIANERRRRPAAPEGTPSRPDGRAEPPGRAADDDPAWVVHVGGAAFYVRRLVGHADQRDAVGVDVPDGRQEAVAPAVHVRLRLCLDDLVEGRWDEARRLAQHGIEVCQAEGRRELAWPAWYALAFLAAARGDEHAAHALTESMRRSAAPSLGDVVGVCFHHVSALVAMGRGDLDAAYAHAAAASPDGRLVGATPLEVSLDLDLVESAIRTGHHGSASARADALCARVGEQSCSHTALIATAARALVATGDDVPLHFERALATPSSERWPFDLARIHLLYGERLRRDRAVYEARLHLSAASAVFQRLRARPWVTRAENELRASGLHAVRCEGSSAALLTSQEREIALLAATGLTNKQIGRRLFLSHRTVGAHLYRIFPKLGITSRAALRDALSALSPGAPSLEAIGA